MTKDIANSIRLGISAEEDWDGPSIKPGTLTDEQIDWLGSWLTGEGFISVDAYENLRRLHEVATERTVTLAAVIEQAKADISGGLGQPWHRVADRALLTLRAADTGAALREVRAAAVEDYASEQLEANISAADWGHAEFVSDARNWADADRKGTI